MRSREPDENRGGSQGTARKERVTTQPPNETVTFIVKRGVTPGRTEIILRFVLFRGKLAS